MALSFRREIHLFGRAWRSAQRLDYRNSRRETDGVRMSMLPSENKKDAVLVRHFVDGQVSPPQHGQQQIETQTAQPQTRQVTSSSSIGEFIVDDLKLFVSPVTAVINEFRRQVKL